MREDMEMDETRSMRDKVEFAASGMKLRVEPIDIITF